MNWRSGKELLKRLRQESIVHIKQSYAEDVD